MLPPSPEAKKQSNAGISIAGFGGTCDVISSGIPNSVSGVPDGSYNPEPVVEEEKKPQKKSDTRETHVHAHRHQRHDHRPRALVVLHMRIDRPGSGTSRSARA